MNTLDDLTQMRSSRSDKEEQYIADRAAYVAGKEGRTPESFTQRSQELYMMGASYARLLQEESHPQT